MFCSILVFKNYLLATVHRAEITGHPEFLLAIVDALGASASSVQVEWPLHPRTRVAFQRTGRVAELSRRITLIDPVGYMDMVQLKNMPL